MKKSGQVGWAAAAVALAAVFAWSPSAARAVCVGDCNGDNEVTVNELITMVNIALGTQEVSACTAGDANGDGQIFINEIIAGVNNALNGCPPEGGCGNAVTDGDEECDDGGICIGGTNAGTACDNETDCQGEGVCDAFGIPGGGVRKVCSSDADCGGAKCIHCKTFGGDGCAANCTTETRVQTTLVPGELAGTDIKEGTSGAIVHGDILTIPLPLVGSNTFTSGKQKNNRIPLVQKAVDIILDRIPVSTLACACVRGRVFMTCGGTQFEADGQTASTNCTDDASVCAGKKPCTAVAGPDNAAEGAIGCDALPSASYTVVQDAGGESGVAGPAIFTPGEAGGPGSQILATASAIGTVVGLCTGTTPDYGPDGEFCTDDDPTSTRGTASVQTLVTGTATATMLNANDIPDNDIGPFSFTGNPVSCANIEAGNLTGGALAGAFTSPDQATVGDIAVTNVFVTQ